MTYGFLLAVSVILVFCGRPIDAAIIRNFRRLKRLHLRRLKAERRSSPQWAGYRYLSHKDPVVCNRCARQLPPAPTSEKREVPFASTGCVLTDQIFEAARAKGIMPVDFLGPAPRYDD